MGRACVLLGVCLVALRVNAAEPPQRVRGTTSLARRVISWGLRDSPTIVALVKELDTSDVTVYVEVVPLQSGTARTALLGAGSTALSPVAQQRYLLVSVHNGHPPDQLIELLGHELQHAVEISRAPGVRDPQGLAALYRRIGLQRQPSRTFETRLAQSVGERVRRELSTRPGYRRTAF